VACRPCGLEKGLLVVFRRDRWDKWDIILLATILVLAAAGLYLFW
jgi:hypothetical protein